MSKKFPNNLILVKKNMIRGGGGVLSLYEDPKTKKKYILKELYRKNINQYLNLLYIQDLCKDFYICTNGLYEKNGKYYIIIDYLEGYITLKHSKKLFSNTIKEKILEKIKRELKKLHKKNMTHNDIKPTNIMVHPETKDVRIIDFGSAIIHSPYKKYKLKNVGYTKKYIQLDPDKLYSKGDFIKNDLYALSLIYSWYKN